jgi:hypothetical protein
MPKRSVGATNWSWPALIVGTYLSLQGARIMEDASEPPMIQGPMVLGPRFPSIKSEPVTAKHKAHNPGRCVRAT